MAKPAKQSLLSKKSAILLTLLIILGAIIFITAFIGMRQGTGLGQLNEPILLLFSTHRTDAINTLMQIATTTASPSFFVIIATAGAFIWSIKKREIWRPFLMTVSIILSASVSSMLKLIIKNPRPEIFDMVPPVETSFSFPSGHTLSTIVFLLVVGYLFYSRYRDSDKHFWLGIWMTASLMGTIIIVLTRLYLGYHWFTDTVASVGLGLIIFALVILIDKIFILNYKKLTKLI